MDPVETNSASPSVKLTRKQKRLLRNKTKSQERLKEKFGEDAPVQYNQLQKHIQALEKEKDANEMKIIRKQRTVIEARKQVEEKTRVVQERLKERKALENELHLLEKGIDSHIQLQTIQQRKIVNLSSHLSE